MNWETIIISLGIAIITSTLSILGTVIINNHNYKIAIEQKKQETIKDVLMKRIDCYKKILISLNYISENITNESAIKNSGIIEPYTNDEIYISEHVYFCLKSLIKDFDTKTPNKIDNLIFSLKIKIKKEINYYLGIPNSNKDKNYPKN